MEKWEVGSNSNNGSNVALQVAESRAISLRRVQEIKRWTRTLVLTS